MVEYQFGYMYWRYLMWNFVGRQNDNQGRMDTRWKLVEWCEFIDELHLDLKIIYLRCFKQEGTQRIFFYHFF
jgi:hypothetical protein